MYRQTYPARRMFIVIIAITGLLFAIWLQLVRWQVLYAQSSPTVRQEEPSPHMGNIVDAHGVLLAFDAPRYTLGIDKRVIPPDEKEDARAWLLAQGFSSDQVAKALDGSSPVTEFRGVTYRVADAAKAHIQELINSGRRVWLRVDVNWVRAFPQGSVAMHVLGIRDWQRPPKAVGGVHEYYAPFLSKGEELNLEYAREAAPPGGTTPFFPSPYKRDLVLTINTGVQYWVEQELAAAVERYQAKSGSVIVMDPRDGSILALANWPSLDPNRFYERDPSDPAWINRAVTQVYEPGSVIKAVTFAAALDAGAITTDTVIFDPGVWEYGGVIIRNSQQRGYGNVTPEEILAKSLNVPTAMVADRLGPTTFYRYLDLFGFGRLTEIDQAKENAGGYRRPRDSAWSLSDLATNSFGQAIKVTPIQMIRAIAAIANGGYLVRPHVLKGYQKGDTYFEMQTPPRQRVIQTKTARVLTSWLTKVVDSISIPDRVDGYRVAGKTGTAQVILPGESTYAKDEQNVTFVGFFPAEDPQVIMLVFLERPQRGPLSVDPKYIWAFNTAYPTFVRIADRIAPLLDIVPPRAEGGE